MNKWLRLLSVLILALACSPLYAYAGEVELYVRNRPFSGALYLDGREIYVPLEAFLRAMGYSWSLGADGIHLMRKSGGGEPIPPGAGELTFVTEKGSFTLRQKNHRGSGYVSLKETAGNLGAVVSYNEALGIVDVIMPPGGMSASEYTEQSRKAKEDARINSEKEEERKRKSSGKEKAAGAGR